MGEANDRCIKQPSPFLSYSGPQIVDGVTTTTSTTTTTIKPDFFLLPNSGINCPAIIIDLTNGDPLYTDILDQSKNIFICNSDLYDPNPCILESDKYVRVADINVVTNSVLCSRYKLTLTDVPTTTTSTTTSSTTSTTTTLNPYSCNSTFITYQSNGIRGVTSIVNYGTFFTGVVTGSNTGSLWGNNSHGYTDDSNFSKAAVHAGILSIGQTATLKFLLLGVKNNFPGSISNGITSSPWSTNWCAIQISLF